MNGRPWTTDDTSTLRRLLKAGRTAAQIGAEMKRHPVLVRAKTRALGLKPGQAAIYSAMMARIRLRNLTRS